VNGYRFHLTCPNCAGPVEHRHGTDGEDPEVQSAEVWCADCLAVYRVVARLELVECLAELFAPSDRARRLRAADAAGIY
jgi:hypothetical protein